MFNQLDILVAQQHHSSLDYLVELEKEICDRFSVDTFSELGHGSLPSFLLRHGGDKLSFLNSVGKGVSLDIGRVFAFVRHCAVCFIKYYSFA